MRRLALAVGLGLFASAAYAQCPFETLVSPSPTADRFGSHLAINEHHLIIVDTRDTHSSGVFAYRRDASGGYSFQGELDATGNLSDVALHQDSAVVTTWFSTICDGETGAHLFEFVDGEWVRTGEMCDLTIQAYGVVLDADMALMHNGSSSVAVFFRSGDLWERSQTLSNPDSPGVASGFGVSMAIDDRFVVIGAYTERTIAGNGGAVYVYRRLPAGGLELQQKLVASDVRRGPRFGSAVALSGDTLVVGGYIADRAFEDQGAVYVYRLVDGQWELEQELTHSDPDENDQFGFAVATDGERIVASANQADTRFQTAGRVFVFERDGSSTWVQTQDIDRGVLSFRYGTVLGLGADVLAVGPGSAYVDLVDLERSCCTPDLDGDGALTVFDYLAFQTLFDSGDMRADFDEDGTLTIFDFLVFQSDFVDGC